jgi:hypothetical protein
VFNGSIVARIVKIYSGARLWHHPVCLAGATVTLTDDSTGATRTTLTTSSGYDFAGLTADGRTFTVRLDALPAGYSAQQAFAGTFGGVIGGATTVSGILPVAGSTGTGYDFAVRRN